jgi:beta-glucosidase
MSQWLDRVTAVLETWYSGQEGGTALAEILFGEVGPSGRLPVSFERRWEDNPAHDYYYPQPGTDRVEYKEGVFVGYRGYQKNNAKPLFPFGFGLSYTTFAYDHLHVNGKAVDFDVANTGKREGAEVAEIYISPQNPRIPRPIRELKGFARVELRPGETRHVEIKLDDRAFAYWDSGEHHWRTDPGLYTIEVGRSSAEIELKAAITLPATQR